MKLSRFLLIFFIIFLFFDVFLAGFYFLKRSTSSQVSLNNLLDKKITLDKKTTLSLLQETGVLDSDPTQEVTFSFMEVDGKPGKLVSAFMVYGKFAYGFDVDRKQDELDIILYFDREYLQKEKDQKSVVKSAVLKALMYLGKVNKTGKRLTNQERQDVYKNLGDLSKKYDFLAIEN